MWSTVHALDGRVSFTKRSDVTLWAGGKRIKEDRAKADAFMKLYSAASHIPSRVKEDRSVTHHLTNHQ